MSSVSNFTEIRPMVTSLIRADRRSDGRKKANRSLS